MTPHQKYSIDYQDLTAGKHWYEFDISDDIFTLWEESEVKKGSLKAKIELMKYSSIMELDVDIIGSVEVMCDRCLDNFWIPVKYKSHLVVKISATPGHDDGDIMWLHPSDDELNLAQYLYESIMLSLPYERVHPNIEDCDADMLNRFKIIDPTEIVDEESQQQDGE